jgi:hypothetical protein
MATETYNDYSPWMKALYMADDSGDGELSPDEQEQQKAQQTPQPVQPVHRIEDQGATSRHGGTPGSSTPVSTAPAPTNESGFYDSANWHAQDPARLPLEQAITSDRTALNRMNQPTQTSLMDRVKNVISGAALGANNYATLRDRQQARQVQQKEDLANRISTNTRALSQETMQEEGQNLRARLAAQAQVASAQRLGETLANRTQNVGMQQAGATERTNLTQEGADRRTDLNNATRLEALKGSLDYKRWKENLDNATKLSVARMRQQVTQDKAPSAVFQTAEFANGGIKSLNDAESAMAELERSGVMGQSWAQNKVEDWIFGKGAVDPSVPPDVRKTIGKLRNSLNLTASAMTRAHTQRGSREVYDDLKQMLGPGQDWQALRGAMDESRDMLNQYVQAASDASIKSLRQGTSAPPQQAAPQAKSNDPLGIR